MNFTDLKINNNILKALNDCGYTSPSDIQQKAIPKILDGKDILATAKTGSGKTCAFMVPIINGIIGIENKSIKALVLTPTRELALQIYENTINYTKYTNVKSIAIFGGTKEGSQKTALAKGVDILIATPGRLIDFMNQGVISLKNINYLVLDEADRMLDMGFINDVKKIVSKASNKRQTLLFSATMPNEIISLCNTLLKNPARIEVDDKDKAVETINQQLYFVDKVNKINLLIDLLKSNVIYRALVFTRTKHLADRVSRQLVKASITSASIHGDKSQNARQRALNDFKDNKLQALVATDIAARGIDINDLEAVINFDLPDTSETYVHRIGRTARQGKNGVAISFCCIDEEDVLKDIERKCKIHINRMDNSKYEMKILVKTKNDKSKSKPSNNRNKPNSCIDNFNNSKTKKQRTK